MMHTGDAVKTVQLFFDAYLVRRDVAGALAYLTDGVQWIGTGMEEMVCGREQARQSLQAKFELSPQPYRIEYERTEESPALPGYAAVLLTASAHPEAGGAAPIWFRASAVCVSCEDGVCRILSIHTSTPDSRQADGAFFPAAPYSLERQLGANALDIMGRNIPGGMMGGYLEPDFPLYYVNDYMLSYLGFTYPEFVEAIGGKVINCMHPEDRARVDEVVTKAFQADAAYEIQYRMIKKDGSYIWVNDVGKKGLSEDGREVCISVIRDISQEVEARERLEKQAARYDHLFHSMLCAIVQYTVTEQGMVFKNANREAIRLFGYTDEAFWAKKYWDPSKLIVEEDRERVVAEIGRLKEPGDMNPFEYRMIRKDGASCWVIGRAEVIVDTDGEQVIQSVYLDINERKKAEQRSERLAAQVDASNEVLHLALEHTTACEFYYYPKIRMCVMPERTCEIYHCGGSYEQMPESFAQEQVAEAYRPAFYEMYARIHRGERTAACEFQSACGSYWCRVTLSVIRFDEQDGAPQFAIGIVEDITRQKEMEQVLEEARTRDSLTGLYNKEHGIRRIKDFLKNRAEDDHGVLMLLDMDDFEAINQKEGNVFADGILQEAADVLRAETGSEDIAARLGGDEFMLFFRHRTKAQATVIGPRIAARVQGVLANADRELHVSVSIGMCSSEVSGDYSLLYRCAEAALKYVKEHGKGRAACYLDTSNEVGMLLTKLYTDAHPISAIEQSAPPVDLAAFALDLLGKAKRLDDAVFLLLSRIGKTCGFDRVSIIESNRAYLSWHFSYQWARDPKQLQLGQDFYVSDKDFDDCSNMYDEDGLADHNLRDDISHIKSSLHAGIWDYGEYVGSMSFEVDREGYQWTKEHRKLLIELVKIVPSFIMKSKADAVSRAKTDFLSRMSHEIRTPMNAISGMTTIAKSVVHDPVKTLDCLKKIESSNVYLLSLVNDILDMSRIESGKLELNIGPLDLTQLLASLESLFHAQALEKGLTMCLEDGRSGNRPLLADGLRLNQVLVNIIGNAIKFTDQGGVMLRVEELEAEPRAVLRFSVTDTGDGIEPAAMSRIFNAFEQADAGTAARRGGTGLGLSISSRLVQMMGGTLEVRSEQGRGSEFFFTLSLDYAPEKPVSGAALKTPEPPKTMPNFKGHRILLAEDNELNREIAQTILEMNGFAVTCAADGKEALDRFCSEEPGLFAAILMDIRMPVMDGLEATRRIRTSGRPDARTVPIIALSANAFDEDAKKSIANGMDGHLAKPIQVEQLLEVLGEHLL